MLHELRCHAFLVLANHVQHPRNNIGCAPIPQIQSLQPTLYRDLRQPNLIHSNTLQATKYQKLLGRLQFSISLTIAATIFSLGLIRIQLPQKLISEFCHGEQYFSLLADAICQ